MTIYPTSLSIRTQNCWQQHNNAASKALMRVSSGKRINSAADDPAGMAIAERMKAQLTILARQQSIAEDMRSVAEIEDGILSSVGSIMNRMKDLAQQATSGTLTDQDRKNLDLEYQEMLKAINGMDKFKEPPSFDLFSATEAFDGTDTGPPGAAAEPGTPAEPITLENVNLVDYLNALDDFMTGLGSTDANSIRDKVLEFSRNYAQGGITSTEMPRVDVKNAVYYTLDITSRNVKLTRSVTEATDRYGLTDTNLLTQEGASDAMDALKSAHELLLSRRGEFGALENRLTHTISNLQNMEEGLTDSYSRLVDADIAKEYSTFVREQMLCQVSNIMLAQINSNAYQVLQLLQ